VVGGPLLLILVVAVAARVGRGGTPASTGEALREDAPPATPERPREDARPDARRLGAAGRFRATLTVTSSGVASFGPMVSASGVTRALERPATRMLVPPAKPGPAAQVTYLVRVDADGSVSSAEPVGALSDPLAARAIAEALRGARVVPHSADEPVMIALEVTLVASPAPPPPS